MADASPDCDCFLCVLIDRESDLYFIITKYLKSSQISDEIFQLFHFFKNSSFVQNSQLLKKYSQINLENKTSVTAPDTNLNSSQINLENKTSVTAPNTNLNSCECVFSSFFRLVDQELKKRPILNNILAHSFLDKPNLKSDISVDGFCLYTFYQYVCCEIYNYDLKPLILFRIFTDKNNSINIKNKHVVFDTNTHLNFIDHLTNARPYDLLSRFILSYSSNNNPLLATLAFLLRNKPFYVSYLLNNPEFFGLLDNFLYFSKFKAFIDTPLHLNLSYDFTKRKSVYSHWYMSFKRTELDKNENTNLAKHKPLKRRNSGSLSFKKNTVSPIDGYRKLDVHFTTQVDTLTHLFSINDPEYTQKVLSSTYYIPKLTNLFVGSSNTAFLCDFLISIVDYLPLDDFFHVFYKSDYQKYSAFFEQLEKKYINKLSDISLESKTIDQEDSKFFKQTEKVNLNKLSDISLESKTIGQEDSTCFKETEKKIINKLCDISLESKTIDQEDSTFFKQTEKRNLNKLCDISLESKTIGQEDNFVNNINPLNSSVFRDLMILLNRGDSCFYSLIRHYVPLNLEMSVFKYFSKFHFYDHNFYLNIELYNVSSEYVRLFQTQPYFHDFMTNFVDNIDHLDFLKCFREFEEVFSKKPQGFTKSELVENTQNSYYLQKYVEYFQNINSKSDTGYVYLGSDVDNVCFGSDIDSKSFNNQVSDLDTQTTIQPFRIDRSASFTNMKSLISVLNSFSPILHHVNYFPNLQTFECDILLTKTGIFHALLNITKLTKAKILELLRFNLQFTDKMHFFFEYVVYVYSLQDMLLFKDIFHSLRCVDQDLIEILDNYSATTKKPTILNPTVANDINVSNNNIKGFGTDYKNNNHLKSSNLDYKKSISHSSYIKFQHFPETPYHIARNKPFNYILALEKHSFDLCKNSLLIYFQNSGYENLKLVFSKNFNLFVQLIVEIQKSNENVDIKTKSSDQDPFLLNIHSLDDFLVCCNILIAHIAKNNLDKKNSENIIKKLVSLCDFSSAGHLFLLKSVLSLFETNKKAIYDYFYQNCSTQDITDRETLSVESRNSQISKINHNIGFKGNIEPSVIQNNLSKLSNSSLFLNKMHCSTFGSQISPFDKKSNLMRNLAGSNIKITTQNTNIGHIKNYRNESSTIKRASHNSNISVKNNLKTDKNLLESKRDFFDSKLHVCSENTANESVSCLHKNTTKNKNENNIDLGLLKYVLFSDHTINSYYELSILLLISDFDVSFLYFYFEHIVSYFLFFKDLSDNSIKLVEIETINASDFFKNEYLPKNYSFMNVKCDLKLEKSEIFVFSVIKKAFDIVLSDDILIYLKRKSINEFLNVNRGENKNVIIKNNSENHSVNKSINKSENHLKSKSENNSVNKSIVNSENYLKNNSIVNSEIESENNSVNKSIVNSENHLKNNSIVNSEIESENNLKIKSDNHSKNKSENKSENHSIVDAENNLNVRSIDNSENHSIVSLNSHSIINERNISIQNHLDSSFTNLIPLSNENFIVKILGSLRDKKALFTNQLFALTQKVVLKFSALKCLKTTPSQFVNLEDNQLIKYVINKTFHCYLNKIDNVILIKRLKNMLPILKSNNREFIVDLLLIIANLKNFCYGDLFLELNVIDHTNQLFLDYFVDILSGFADYKIDILYDILTKILSSDKNKINGPIHEEKNISKNGKLHAISGKSDKENATFHPENDIVFNTQCSIYCEVLVGVLIHIEKTDSKFVEDLCDILLGTENERKNTDKKSDERDVKKSFENSDENTEKYIYKKSFENTDKKSDERDVKKSFENSDENTEKYIDKKSQKNFNKNTDKNFNERSFKNIHCVSEKLTANNIKKYNRSSSSRFLDKVKDIKLSNNQINILLTFIPSLRYFKKHSKRFESILIKNYLNNEIKGIKGISQIYNFTIENEIIKAVFEKNLKMEGLQIFENINEKLKNTEKKYDKIKSIEIKEKQNHLIDQNVGINERFFNLNMNSRIYATVFALRYENNEKIKRKANEIWICNYEKGRIQATITHFINLMVFFNNQKNILKNAFEEILEKYEEVLENQIERILIQKSKIKSKQDKNTIQCTDSEEKLKVECGTNLYHNKIGSVELNQKHVKIDNSKNHQIDSKCVGILDIYMEFLFKASFTTDFNEYVNKLDQILETIFLLAIKKNRLLKQAYNFVQISLNTKIIRELAMKKDFRKRISEIITENKMEVKEILNNQEIMDELYIKTKETKYIEYLSDKMKRSILQGLNHNNVSIRKCIDGLQVLENVEKYELQDSERLTESKKTSCDDIFELNKIQCVSASQEPLENNLLSKEDEIVIRIFKNINFSKEWESFLVQIPPQTSIHYIHLNPVNQGNLESLFQKIFENYKFNCDIIDEKYIDFIEKCSFKNVREWDRLLDIFIKFKRYGRIEEISKNYCSENMIQKILQLFLKTKEVFQIEKRCNHAILDEYLAGINDIKTFIKEHPF